MSPRTGRPTGTKTGANVVARSVTLTPKHWAHLKKKGKKIGGVSAAIRAMVDKEREKP